MPNMSKSRNTTAKLPPVHPGELLRETLTDLKISMNQFAQQIHVPANRISAIIAGKRAITAETALRFARYFGTSAAYWVNLQAHYDLETAMDEYDAVISAEVRPRSSSAAA
jgi:addiction module HigA family antidote